jgi:hypothetical protein
MTILVRLVLAIAGLGLAVWTIATPVFRDVEGIIQTRSLWPLALAAACLVWAGALGGRWHRAGGWLGLALIGQASALQLIVAGPFVRYQHYLEMSGWAGGTARFWFLVLLVQAALVVSALLRRREIVVHAARLLPRWSWAILAGFLVLASAALSRSPVVYLVELVTAASVQLLQMGNLVLFGVAAAVAGSSETEVLPGLQAPTEPSGMNSSTHAAPLGYAGVAAIWVTALAAVLNVFVYQSHPHVEDEVVYMIHARSLAQGSLDLPAPPSTDGFEVYLMRVDGDRWYASTPPGWPLALSIGYLIGLPWLVNPILGGLNLLAIAFLVYRLYGDSTARWTVTLLAISPWYVFMAMNFMTHTFTLTCALAGAVAVEKARDSNAVLWAAIAGFSIGVLSWIRPMEGALIAVLLGLWSLGVGGRRRLPVAAVATLVAATALTAVAIFPYNAYLTGDPTYFPIQAYVDHVFGQDTNAMGFGPERGLGWTGLDPLPGHGLVDVAINFALNLSLVNLELFGWGAGSLLFLGFFFVSGGVRRFDLPVLAVLVSIPALYSLYWFSGGPDFGARYWYLIIVPCVVLSVRGVQRLADRLASGVSQPTVARRGVALSVLSFSVIALLTFFPWRAVDKYYHYLGMRPDIRVLAEEHDFGRSLVLVQGDQVPDYESAAAFNPLDLQSDVPIYAWDRDENTRREVLAAYSDRPVWIVAGPTITGAGYSIVDGPILPEEVVVIDGR